MMKHDWAKDGASSAILKKLRSKSTLAHFTNNRQLKIFLSVDMNLLSRFVVRFEVNIYNSKDSCEGSG